MKPKVLVITCEHASNHIPVAFEVNFLLAQKELNSHLGWDPGAIELACHLSERLTTPLYHYEYSRLLIEVNRSIGHPQLFSQFTNTLESAEKNVLIHEYYLPYRKEVEQKISGLVNNGNQVVHLGVHTFTPELNGQVREVEIGLLFDPDRASEHLFNQKWMGEINGLSQSYVVRLNEPYLGKDDGFTTYLRTRFGDAQYIGIELEVSQKFSKSDLELYRLLEHSLRKTLNH